MKERITVYVMKEKYKQLRAKLILLGVSFTAWLNKKIDEEIKE